MADFNNIFTTSSMYIQSESLAMLGFNDGKAVSKSKYALEAHTLSLYMDSLNTFSILYSNNTATVYEFKAVLSSNAGVQLPTIDENNQIVSNLIKEDLLVFVNGVLESEKNYDILENNIIVIKNNKTDTNNPSTILVYSSRLQFSRKIYTHEDNLDFTNIPCKYNKDTTLIFLNKQKVDFDKIFISNSKNNAIALNLKEIPTNYILEIITFANNSVNGTKTLNFVTNQGYLTYGPLDDFDVYIPTMYNIIVTFTEQAKLVVDNLRKGFIIKEKDGYGEALVVDDNFESKQIRCIILAPFSKNRYSASEYYLNVPEATSIVKYLAEFDTKYTFLPEILTVFQRLLLDDINDSIQRLRDMRSIQKVDSVNINKLISLLGFNLNIKTLDKKQRRELLEELNEFYRIVGTRSSYNLLNILQNNLKLIEMDQFFTPFGSKDNKNKEPIYNYNVDITNPGTGYRIGDVLRATQNGSILAIVRDITPDEGTDDPQGDYRGGIKELELVNPQGHTDLNLDLDLEAYPRNIKFTTISSPIKYRYTNTITNSSGYLAGQRFVVVDQTTNIFFNILVNKVDINGKITDWTLSCSSPTINTRTMTGTTAVNISNASLALANRKISISSVESSRQLLINTSATTSKTLELSSGTYSYEIAGAGGGGSEWYASYKANSGCYWQNGSSGERKSGTFKLTDSPSGSFYIEYTAGSGGAGGAAARNGHTGGAGGTGYEWGGAGGSTWFKASDNKYSAGAGGGGGSTRIGVRVGNNTFFSDIARGGNGGNAATGRSGWALQTVYGGIGGSGGVYSGSGGAGGAGGYGDRWASDPAGSGQAGWVKLSKITYRPTARFTGDVSDLKAEEAYMVSCIVPSEFSALRSSKIYFTVTATKDGSSEASIYPNNINFSISGTYPTVSNNSGKFNFYSTPINYKNTLTVKGLEQYIPYLKGRDKNLPGSVQYGDRFYNTEGTPFEYKILSIANGEITDSTFEPKESINNITDVIDVPAYYQTGTGAKIYMYSGEYSQSTLDRCYVDFYTKEELGAERQYEYRYPKLDYLYITEGTPASPNPFEAGKVDIDYGTITEGTPNSPNPNAAGVPDIDYGLITTEIKGEWVEWWKWDRDPIWYPTNHVYVELKMPVDIDFQEYCETFTEQFYNLASTVVYLHELIEAFYFGNDTEGIDPNNPSNGKNPLFGIATGAPITYMEMTFTSDPANQYLLQH